MKFYLTTIFSFFIFSVSQSQTYNMSNTDVITCGGTFYDSGGVSGRYSNYESYIKTFTPSIAGNYLQFVFTAFSTEDTFDFLYIYDGTSTSAPLIGTLTGSTLPGTFVASNPSGALTFEFISDDITRDRGWAATISCAPIPTCLKPTSLNVSDIKQTSATLTWTDPGLSTSWQVIAVPCGSSPPIPSTVGTSAVSPYVLSGLTENTCYDFYVKDICASSESSFWYGPISANTLAPPLPSCVNNTPAGDSACQAVNICNLNGYCGNTSVSFGATTDWYELTGDGTANSGGAFCGDDDNDSFLTFVASATTVDLKVWITSSTDGSGIQIMVFSADACDSGPVTSNVCWNPFTSETLVLNTPYTVTATGLTPGQTYYMLIDGFGGDSCDYIISAGAGVVTQVNVATTKNTLCLGQSTTLLATGGNGNYTWTPSAGLNVTTGANVTFTPTAIGTYTITATSSDGNPNCPQSLFASQTIVVNDLPIAPAITSPVVYCQGQIATPLTATGIGLLWYTTASGGIGSVTAPTPSTTATGDTLYYVSQSLGSCEGPRATITVTVNLGVTPTFIPVADICSGEPLAELPTTSNNGITGNWLPALNNTTTTPYTFTPTAGQCAATAALTITVKPGITPIFTPIAAICSGTTLTALPTRSNNGITGNWAPALDNTATTPYTFTPTAGQCAATATLTITVNQKTIPTFTAVPTICSGDVLTALPTRSNNSIVGTWLPALNNTTTTPYTFTPATGECAITATLTISVNQKTTPTFAGFAPICYGETPPALPATSTNGISGTWVPTTISNTATDTYTFTPNAGQCALSAPLNVTVLSSFDFSISEKCVGSSFVLQVDPSLNSFATNAVAYTWQNSNGATVGTNDSTFDVTAYLNSTTSVSEQLPITFSVIVLNDVCSISHSHIIDKMYCDIQKGISPNGDSKNDFFDLRLLGVKKLEIFNRYGTKVYSRANYTKEWYGQTDGGVDLPDETYFYVMELASETKTGWIYINREHK